MLFPSDVATSLGYISYEVAAMGLRPVLLKLLYMKLVGYLAYFTHSTDIVQRNYRVY